MGCSCRCTQASFVSFDCRKHYQEYEIRLLGSKLGRPFKDNDKNKARIHEPRKIEQEDQSTWIAVEAKFEEAKWRYMLEKIGRKLKETSETSIRWCSLVMDLMMLGKRKGRAFCVDFGWSDRNSCLVHF